MGRKLTPKEKEDRLIDSVVRRIRTIEKDYGLKITRIGCHRYHYKTGEELKLKRIIKEKESELQDLKSKKR